MYYYYYGTTIRWGSAQRVGVTLGINKSRIRLPVGAWLLNSVWANCSHLFSSVIKQ